jgi:AcrR family transcriptional regulator
VTPPSIYLHFEDKDDLIFEVCQAQFRLLHQCMREAADRAGDPLLSFKEMGRAYIRFGIDHPEEYRILFMSRSDFGAQDFVDGTMPGLESFQSVLDALVELQELGIVREGDPLVITSGIWALVHGVTSLCIAFDGFPFVGQDELVEHCLDNLMEGLAAG